MVETIDLELEPMSAETMRVLTSNSSRHTLVRDTNYIFAFIITVVNSKVLLDNTKSFTSIAAAFRILPRKFEKTVQQVWYIYTAYRRSKKVTYKCFYHSTSLSPNIARFN